MKKRSFVLTVKESAKLLMLLLNPSKNRAPEVYNLLATHNNLADKSLYLNLGYWETATTYDDACEALADQLGVAASFEATDEVLDVGFGFGDQDKFWVEKYGPKRIVGINITESQVAEAKTRNAHERIEFRHGSATEMPFEAFERRLEIPGLRSEAAFVAVDGDLVVGCTELVVPPGDPDALRVGYTGVLRSHRRRGIAMALKLRAVQYARSVGANSIQTDNAESNPMYQINLRLGFVPQPAWLCYTLTGAR